jgi:tetratricopeptide (TPR) repeat protein
MMKKIISLIIALLLLISISPAFAETKTFIKEYTYQASEYDSKVSCRALALEQVKRMLLEELGTYLESQTEVKNFQMTKDQIITLAAGIVMVQIIDERWDGKTYFLKAKMAADPQDVYKSIDNLRQDHQKAKEMEESRQRADDALREVEKLKKKLDIAKAGKTEQAQYQKAVNRLSATDWYERGHALSKSGGTWQQAMDSYTMAIDLDPGYADAYFSRAMIALVITKDYSQAIRDFSRCMELEPKTSSHLFVYLYRGSAYIGLGDHRRAIMDYDRVIELNYDTSITSMAYAGRGDAHAWLGNYNQTIKDYDKAIELYPKNSIAFAHRGWAYVHLKNYMQATSDFKIAAKLGDKETQDFLRKEGIEW